MLLKLAGGLKLTDQEKKDLAVFMRALQRTAPHTFKDRRRVKGNFYEVGQ
jgi:ribosomal protein S7